MRYDFVSGVLNRMLADKQLLHESSILAVCAGRAEHALFGNTGFTNVILTGLDPVLGSDEMQPFSSMIADVRDLEFDDNAYDFVFVSDGLHHCDSPHRALLEMYRVAKKGIIVFESRDSVLMRAGVMFGIADEYEIRAVRGNDGERGGVNYTSIPNFVYRWTEREFEKTIRTVNPAGRPTFRYFYGFNPPNRRVRRVKKFVYSCAFVVARALSKLAKRQSNSFCMVAFKPTTLFPWLEMRSGTIRFNKTYAGKQAVGSP